MYRPQVNTEALDDNSRLYDFINTTEEIMFSVVSALVASPGCVSAPAQRLPGSAPASPVTLIKNKSQITENRWKLGPAGSWTLPQTSCTGRRVLYW